MQALLVVDIDYSCGWDQYGIQNDPDKQKIAEELKKLLRNWREKKGIIAFVTFPGDVDGQEFQLEKTQLKVGSLLSTAKKCLVCDRGSGRLAEFLEHRHGTEFEAAFVKKTCDAFTNNALAAYFRSKNVKEILLAGCSTGACVMDTAIGAVQAGFNVTLIEKCVYPPFGDEKEPKKYWTNKVGWLGFVKSASRADQQVKIA